MNIYWKYKVPTLKKPRSIEIQASLRNGFVQNISFNEEEYHPEIIHKKELLSLSQDYPFLLFNFLNKLILKDESPSESMLSTDSPYFILKILEDYFTTLEIMKQIKYIAQYFNDKALYQTITLFFQENTFNEIILKRLIEYFLNPNSLSLKKDILTIKDIFFLYDLIIGYEREKEKEGRGYLTMNNALFNHFYKKITILACNFYELTFDSNPFFDKISVPLYRKKLLQDLKKSLQTMRNDLEILSGKEDKELWNYSKHISTDITDFQYGKIIFEKNHCYTVNYLYGNYIEKPDIFYSLHHKALEFFFLLLNFTEIRKEYS
ncbi:MAG: hypothetical protein PHS99_02055 [Candidatus Marinimicrobia bacterium]|nr:hypothetical protein [Candidatus Neomarinimicrobiota bacterium]